MGIKRIVLLYDCLYFYDYFIFLLVLSINLEYNKIKNHSQIQI
jgi:hypothetical protein